jgi:hypothetical protein
MSRSLCALLLCVIGAPALADDRFVELFDGESLGGWTVRGGDASFRVERSPEGGFEVVGTSKAGAPNTFLCTEREYADFVLEFEVKIDPALNSGVQFRSAVYAEDRATKVRDGSGVVGEALQPKGRVYGYQAEIDPSPRGWSGGVYDEARRGWIAPLDKPEHAPARKAFNNAGWNLYRIEARGDELRTFVNDVACADLVDDASPRGFIALQVHSIESAEQAGKEVRWRNVRIATAE